MNVFHLAAVMACSVACTPMLSKGLPNLQLTNSEKSRSFCGTRGVLAHKIATERDAGKSREEMAIRLDKAAMGAEASEDSVAWIHRLLTTVYDHPGISPNRFERAEIRACMGAIAI